MATRQTDDGEWTMGDTRLTDKGNRCTMQAMKETYLTMTEAAKRMKIGYVTLYRAVESGRIRAIRTPGGRRRIPESEVDRYWSEQNYSLNGVEDEH